MFETIRDFLAAELNIDASTITPDTDLSRDLGADSLDLYELVMAFEDEYDIVVADEAYADYVNSGCKSTPVEEFWRELDAEV